MRTPLAGLLLAPFALAGTIAVPKDQLTIQAAVDAAQPGDIIVISPGIYHEAVLLSGKTQLLVVGKGAVRIDAQGLGVALTADGCTNLALLNLRVVGSTGTGIEVDASTGVTVSKCRLQPPDSGAGADSVTVDGGGLITIDKCKFLGSALGVRLGTAAAPRNVISGVTVSRCLFSEQVGPALTVTAASGVSIQKNTFAHPAETAISVSGLVADVVVHKNRILFPGDVAIFSQDADAFSADANKVLHGTVGGVHVIASGGSVSVVANRLVQCAGVGIAVEADGADVALNRIVKDGDAGIIAAGDLILISFNQIVKSAGQAIDVTGSQCTVATNTFVHAGWVDVFSTGDGSTISNNVAAGGDGYWLTGANLIVPGNRITHSVQHGFFLECSTSSVDGNTSIGAADDGFRITGTGNTLTNNVGKGSILFDLEEDTPGSNSIDGTNSFGTTNEP